MGYSPWGREDSDTTEQLPLSHFHFPIWHVGARFISLGCSKKCHCCVVSWFWRLEIQDQSVGRAICFQSPQKELLLCLFLVPGISWRIIGIPQLIRDPRHPHLHGPMSSSVLTSCITSLPYKGTRCVGEGPPIGPHLNPICLP